MHTRAEFLFDVRFQTLYSLQQSRLLQLKDCSCELLTTYYAVHIARPLYLSLLLGHLAPKVLCPKAVAEALVVEAVLAEASAEELWAVRSVPGPP